MTILPYWRMILSTKLNLMLTRPVDVCIIKFAPKWRPYATCGRGGIGRHVRLRGVCASVPVQVRSTAPKLKPIHEDGLFCTLYSVLPLRINDPSYLPFRLLIPVFIQAFIYWIFNAHKACHKPDHPYNIEYDSYSRTTAKSEQWCQHIPLRSRYCYSILSMRGFCPSLSL